MGHDRSLSGSWALKITGVCTPEAINGNTNLS